MSDSFVNVVSCMQVALINAVKTCLNNCSSESDGSASGVSASGVSTTGEDYSNVSVYSSVSSSAVSPYIKISSIAVNCSPNPSDSNTDVSFVLCAVDKGTSNAFMLNLMNVLQSQLPAVLNDYDAGNGVTVYTCGVTSLEVCEILASYAWNGTITVRLLAGVVG